MAGQNLPPRVIERRSDERQVFELLNALRKKVAALEAAGGGASLSLRFSNGPYGPSIDTEQVVDQFELPTILTSFTVRWAGQMKSASGVGMAFLRLGGGDRTVDGTIISTIDTGSATYVRVSDAQAVVNSGLDTRIKLTMLRSGVGHQVFFKDGTLTVS